MSIWVHRHTSRAEGLLICAIDFLIGSAPRLVNENMLCAGNETWSFLSEMPACPEMCWYTEKKLTRLLLQRGEVMKIFARLRLFSLCFRLT